MKQVKRILSFILIIALLVSLVPAGKDNVKEAEASDYQTVPDVILSDADVNHSDSPNGTKLFFPDITNVPASVYADDSNASEEAKQNGKLLAVYYKNIVHARGFSTSSCTCAAGTPCSSDPYGEIHLVESTDNGETWSEPRKIVDAEMLWKAGVGTEQVPVEGRDPNIAYLSDGTVILTFFTNHIAYDGTQNHTYILESHDGGTTWSNTPVQIDYLGQLRNGSKRGDIADFGDGYVLFPLQGHKTDDSNDYASAVYAQHTYNEEEAKWEWSFKRCTDVTDGNKEGSEINECSFVVTGGADGNEVYALVRANGGVYHSTDRGATWTKIDTEEFQITDKDGNPAILNQPGLKLYTVGGEKYISVTYSVPNTVYGRPVYQKSVKLSDLDPSAINNTGWNNTKAELIYRSPNNTTEAADPSSVITNDGRILVIYYDGDMEYIGGTYIEEPGSKSYTELTLGDFGIATSKTFGAFDSNRTPLKTSNSTASLDGIAISGTYNFTSSTYILIGDVWNYGITAGYFEDGNGPQIYFSMYGQENAIRIRPKDIGGRALLGRDISMRMTFDCLRHDSGTVDFIMGVTFDGYTTHMKFENVMEDNLKQLMAVRDTTVTNPAYADLLDQYEELTLADFGVPMEVKFENADHKVIQTVTPDASLDGKMVTGTYNFSTTSGTNILVFGSSWFGVWVYAYEAYLNVYFYGYDASAGSYVNIPGAQITPAMVDGKSLLGRELNIKMCFDLENPVGDDVDVTCGIIVNDACYETMEFSSVAASNFKQAIGVTAPAGCPMVLKGNAEQLSLEDYGIPKKITFEGVEGKVIQTATPNEGLNGKIISGTFNFYNAAATNKAVLGSAWNGLWLMPSGDNLYGYYYDSSGVTSGQFSITPSEVDGKALPGRDLKMQVYFNYGEIVDDKADLQVVFIIEGIYAKSLIFDDVKVTDLKQRIGIHAPSGYPLVLTGEAEELTLKDFGIQTAKKYGNESHTLIATSTPNETLNGKMISGIYNFYNVSGTNTLGIGSNWYGIWLMPSGDNLYGYYYDESGTQYSAFTITPSEVDGKALPGRDLKLQVYFNYGNVENNRANVLVTFIVEDIFVKSVLFENVSIANIGEKLGITNNGYPFTLIEPSAYPNCYYPQALGATLATNKDVVRMGFNFADVIASHGIAKEDIAEYGAVLVPGTKNADKMQTTAATMIAATGEEAERYVVEGEGEYVRTTGDIDVLMESENKEYYVTITNSGDIDNMHIRATAIAYIKLTDEAGGAIYYSSQCNSDQTQRVNKSVFGLLKAIFADKYVADYDAATVKEDTILYKAVEKYTAKEGAVQKTAAEVADIVKSSGKSTEETRKLFSGVHYAIPELWDGANAELKGKYISILGHSIDSYAGVSNDTNANTTIGNNSCTYPNTFSLTQGDMWWSQVIKDKGMNLLVCNASSGAAVSYDTGDGGIIKKGSDDARALQLHDDNGENADTAPDIIAITLGINDFRSGQGIGTFDTSAWDTICQTKAYPVSGVFADNYAIMLHKITTKYPNAKVFVFNIFESNETLCNTRTNLQEYNEMIATIAAYFKVTVVDAYNDTGINRANANEYTFDGLHFNALGMKKYAKAFEIALMEKFAQ